MLLTVIAVAVGVAAFSHVSPVPFLFDVVAGDLSVWKMPQAAGQREVYLTFDDGPNPTATPQLLDLLAKEQIQATFFLIPNHVNEDTAPIVRRIFEEGHAVAQHSGNRWLMLRSPSGLAKELTQDADRIERLAGHRPCPLFRPHGGWRSIPMLMGVSRARYKLIGWSWMNFDWVWFRRRTGDRVASQVIAHAAPGSIIILHDGHHIDPRADRRYALEAASRIIRELRADGYSFGRLCEP
jgi:chitooligosaccharide deacetylase